MSFRCPHAMGRELPMLALMVTGLSLLSGLAHATPITDTVTYSAYGLPAASGPVNTIDLTGDLGKSTFTVNSGANAAAVSTANGGAVVQGSLANAYADPVTGGTVTNPTYWAAPYFSTGGVPGMITLTFADPQSFLGLLWGSIGAGDYIIFLNSQGTVIATVTGTQAMQAASGFNGTNGAQGFGGSQYTLINFTGGQFSSVVLGQSGAPSFESADFEYAAQNEAAPVPEPASLALLAAGLAGLGAIRRRKAGREGQPILRVPVMAGLGPAFRSGPEALGWVVFGQESQCHSLLV